MVNKGQPHHGGLQDLLSFPPQIYKSNFIGNFGKTGE
jgi:hypothetical protein